MPTYEYECPACGHTFEAFQQMKDKPLEKCPKCHKKVKRLISSGAGFIFKGSGFYATDYRKGPKKGAVCPKAKEGCQGCH
ncbi:MAG: zinc ribbon domain-containing protein [Candidatus Omnitrophica bacterium]|nr:zinc ribbon domain-containing protein [Candidatus Omnitrophota bacterium]